MPPKAKKIPKKPGPDKSGEARQSASSAISGDIAETNAGITETDKTAIDVTTSESGAPAKELEPVVLTMRPP